MLVTLAVNVFDGAAIMRTVLPTPEIDEQRIQTLAALIYAILPEETQTLPSEARNRTGQLSYSEPMPAYGLRAETPQPGSKPRPNRPAPLPNPILGLTMFEGLGENGQVVIRRRYDLSVLTAGQPTDLDDRRAGIALLVEGQKCRM